MVRNAHGHTGTFACSQCDIMGYSVPSGDGHCMTFVEQENELVQRRSHESVTESADLAEEGADHVGF